MDSRDLNEELMDAIVFLETNKVKECLRKGADPDYCRFRDEEEPNGLIQPTTPLRMIMFRISDCDIIENELKEYVKITKILLDHGADPGPAVKIAEDRYGIYKPELNDGCAFMEVYRLVVESNNIKNK